MDNEKNLKTNGQYLSKKRTEPARGYERRAKETGDRGEDSGAQGGTAKGRGGTGRRVGPAGGGAGGNDHKSPVGEGGREGGKCRRGALWNNDGKTSEG